MKKRLLIFAILLVAMATPEYGFSATYIATGVWEYTTSNPWSDDPDCLESTETGLTAIIQNGDTFTYTDKRGINTGTIIDANYTATISYPEEGGLTTQTILFTLRSKTMGSGIIYWTWTDGFYVCSGGSDITVNKQPDETTYDATGIWDYSTSRDWNNCGDPIVSEGGSVSITQNGNTFRFVEQEMPQSGLASLKTYIAVSAYPEDEGTTTESILLTLSSNTSGDGTINWVWTDGIETCYGGYDISITKQAQQPNIPPYKPTLSGIANGTNDISLTPTLGTEIFVDPNSGDQHRQTEWQISKESDFDSTELITIRDTSLTKFNVPKFVLAGGTTYYWRARFYDEHLRASDWSNIRFFKTTTTTNDRNGNGIPDHQEAPNADLDGDGTPDSQQDHIKSLNTFDGKFQMGVSIKDDQTITSIGSIESIDPATVSGLARPRFVPFGLFGAEFKLLNPSDPVEVTFYFSQRAEEEEGLTWYVHNPVDGWVDFSKQATFSHDRMSVTVKIKDWGYGDANGLPDGTVVDPGGFGIASWINGLVTDLSTAEPIHNAVVTISTLELITLIDGQYLSMIHPGTYPISVSASCYKSDSDNIIIPDIGAITRNFQLEKSDDKDKDGAPDACDAFPDDINEWLDTDEDGIGNNADPDDDNDGMPDTWEQQHTLNPLVNDAAEDEDGDGFTNLQEYRGGSDPNDPASKPAMGPHSIMLLLLLI
jgi:hypothetical protein